MRKAARLVLFVFSVAGVACAQIPTRGNIFAGYSYMRADSDVFPAIIPTFSVRVFRFPWADLRHSFTGYSAWDT